MVKVYMQEIQADVVKKQGAGCLIYSNETKRFLIPYRSEKSTPPNNCWGVWGGLTEPEDKSNLDTLVREVKEEAGIDLYTVEKVTIEPICLNKQPTVEFITYLVRVDKEFKPTLNREHTKVGWFTDLQLESIPKEKMHWGLRLAIETMKVEGK
jgi:8-oxo-dGTP pyrophosphatase MutT (NUDIX family)